MVKRTATRDFLQEVRRQRRINAKVFKIFEQHGDGLEALREVCHWAYFRTVSARDRFAQHVQQLGYSTLETKPYPYGNELPFGVQFFRPESVRPAIMNSLCAELVLLAEHFGGEYDGWEAQVIS